MWVGPGDYSKVINFTSTPNTSFSMPWGNATTLNYFMLGSVNQTSGMGYYLPLEAPGEPITAIV